MHLLKQRTQREIDRIKAAAAAAAGVDENVQHHEQQNVPIAPQVLVQQNVPIAPPALMQQNVPVAPQALVQQNVPRSSVIPDPSNAPPVQSIQGNNNPPIIAYPKQEETAEQVVTRDPSPLRLRSRTVQRNQ